jgi:large-conductance mechanosensitive channel
MAKKIATISAYFIMAVLSLIGFLANGVSLLTGSYQEGTGIAVGPIIAFTVAFGILFAYSIFLIIRQVCRLIADIKIRKENQ